MEQLIISEDENTVILQGHKATFKPIDKVTKTICLKCWLYRFDSEVCKTKICMATHRKDGREGIFTIQEMPNKKQI